MDREHHLIAGHHNIAVDSLSGDDLTDFPIEKARLRSIWYHIGVVGINNLRYKWAIDAAAIYVSR